MITHEEALELVKILYFNINEKTNQELNRTSKIYDKLDRTTRKRKRSCIRGYLMFVKNINVQYGLCMNF